MPATYQTTAEQITEYDERFGSRLRRLRTARGFHSYQALADACGMDKRAIQKVETGRRNVSVGEAVAIARALDLSIVDICRQSPVRVPVIPVLVD